MPSSLVIVTVADRVEPVACAISTVAYGSAVSTPTTGRGARLVALYPVDSGSKPARGTPSTVSPVARESDDTPGASAMTSISLSVMCIPGMAVRTTRTAVAVTDGRSTSITGGSAWSPR